MQMQDAIQLNKASRFRTKYFLMVGAVLAVMAAAGTGAYLLLAGGESEAPSRVVIAVQVAPPAGWTAETLTTDDQGAGVLLKLESASPDASFLARTVIGKLPADFDIQKLAADTEAALAADIENFKLVDTKIASAGSFDAVWIRYRQAGEGAAPDYQTMVTVIPTPNQTFFLTIRSEQSDFSEVEAAGRKIIGDVATYVQTVNPTAP